MLLYFSCYQYFYIALYGMKKLFFLSVFCEQNIYNLEICGAGETNNGVNCMQEKCSILITPQIRSGRSTKSRLPSETHLLFLFLCHEILVDVADLRIFLKSYLSHNGQHLYQTKSHYASSFVIHIIKTILILKDQQYQCPWGPAFSPKLNLFR